jgi:hypothetical protein
MICSPVSVICDELSVREVFDPLPLRNLLFSAERSDATILFDLALFPPRDGEGQVSELHVTMSNPIFDSLHLK